MSHKIAISLSLMRIYVLYFSDVYHCPNLKLTHKSAHGHTWGLLPACSPKGEEHIRKLLCRNRLRGLSWKGTSQSRLFATASKQPACPQSDHEPSYVSVWRGYESICHV